MFVYVYEFKLFGNYCEFVNGMGKHFIELSDNDRSIDQSTFEIRINRKTSKFLSSLLNE